MKIHLQDCSIVLNKHFVIAQRYACKRSLCCRPVSVCPSRSCILSTRLKMSSNFFVGPGAHHSSFLTLSAGTQFQGDPFSGGAQSTRGVGKFCDFQLKSSSILETVQDRPMFAMVR